MAGRLSIDHVSCVYGSARAAHDVLHGCLGLRFLRSFTLSSEVAAALFKDSSAETVLVFGDDQRLVEAIIRPGHCAADSPAHVCFSVQNRADVVSRCRSGGLEVRTAWVGDHEVFFVIDADGNLFEIKQH